MSTANELLAHQFVDKRGRVWTIEIDVGLARSIKSQTGIDFVNFGASKDSRKLATDTELFVRVLWLLLEEQTEAQQVDEIAFARGLNGDVLGAAMEAVLEALVNFTPPASRDTMRAMKKRAMELEGKAKAKVIARVNSPEIEKAIMAEFDREMSKAATSTAGS